MRKNFGAKEWLYPMPVFIIGTYDENGNANVMNAAWGSIGDTAQIFLCLAPDHKTVKNLLAKKEFTVSLGTKSQVKACDYAGLVSGNSEPGKVEKAGFHAVKAENVDAPLFEELPFALECKFTSYDEKSGHLFGEIVNVCADEKILTNGTIDYKKLEPVTYDPINRLYITLGESVGHAFKDGLELKK